MDAQGDGDGYEAMHVDAVGGELCLDFTNTVSARDTEAAHDSLAKYDDLIAWSEGVGMVDHVMAMALYKKARQHGEEAEDVVQRARRLRETLYRIFLDQTAGKPPQPADLEHFNRELGRAMAHVRLAPGQASFVWTWEADVRALDWPLWPIVRSAADLLTSDRLDRVRQCAGDQCGWLFVDQSRNRSRRWCDMKDCGNVAKARRYRRRQKK